LWSSTSKFVSKNTAFQCLDIFGYKFVDILGSVEEIGYIGYFFLQSDILDISDFGKNIGYFGDP
jgi:hypothetical protein